MCVCVYIYIYIYIYIMFVMCLFVCRWVLNYCSGDYHMCLLCGIYAHL